MKIEIVGANPVVPISARMNVTGANGKKTLFAMMYVVLLLVFLLLILLDGAFFI